MTVVENYSFVPNSSWDPGENTNAVTIGLLLYKYPTKVLYRLLVGNIRYFFFLNLSN